MIAIEFEVTFRVTVIMVIGQGGVSQRSSVELIF